MASANSSNPPQSGPRQGLDHYGSFNFRVEIEGLDCGGFRSVQGLEVSVDAIEYHVGDQRMPMKRPGRPKVGNIVLEKGYINTDVLWRWCEEVMNGKVSRKSGSIVLMDDGAMGELTRYNFFNAWPTKWSGFKLEGKGNEAMVETLELAVERIQRI
jgi:phage tail-like protein